MNADPRRAAEFIRYYLRRRHRLRVYHGFLEELIYASLDDALRQGELDSETATLAEEFLEQSIFSTSTKAQYWARWSGPVGSLIRRRRATTGNCPHLE